MNKAVPLAHASIAFKAGHKDIAANILIKSYGRKLAIKLLSFLNTKRADANASTFRKTFSVSIGGEEEFPWRVWRGPVPEQSSTQIGTSPRKFKPSEIPSWAKFLEPKLWTPTHILVILGVSAILLSYLFRKK